MKERPILFSGPMVRAILDDRKTQTRRIVKHIPALGSPEEWCAKHACSDFGMIVGDYRSFCPHGQAGDRLWVKETFLAQSFGIDDLTIRYVATPDTYYAHGAGDGSVPVSGLAVYYWMLDKSKKMTTSRLAARLSSCRAGRAASRSRLPMSTWNG